MWVDVARPSGVESSAEISAALARNTASFRRRMGFAQEKLAEEARLPRKTIYNTEKFGNAGTRTIEKLARVFGVPASTMLEEDPETAEAVFLAKQVDRLSARAKQTFFHSMTNQRSAPDLERAATPTQLFRKRSVSSTGEVAHQTAGEGQHPSEAVSALFRLPESRWQGRLEEDPRLFSVASAFAMLAHAEGMMETEPRVAITCYRLVLFVVEAIAKTDPISVHELRASAWKSLGWTLRKIGDYKEAATALDQAEAAARLCANGESMLARVKLTRAILLTTTERSHEALVLVNEARATFEAIHDLERYDMAIEQEAVILLSRHDGARAIPILKRLLNKSTDEPTKARRYYNLAIASELADDLVSARKYLKKAASLAAKLGWTHALCKNRWALGRILAKAGDVDDALTTLECASAEFRALDDADSAVRVDLDRCAFEIENGRHNEEETFDRLRAITSYAIEKRLPQSECRALLFLQQLGRAAKPAHIRYVNDFIHDLAKHPHREFVAPELAA
jgi:tetratricopeptide (TPR) repeat protein/DNA-binding XRE family transcriptional regulator